MDQDSFRRLLKTPRPDSSKSPVATSSKGSLLAVAAKSKPAEASQPAFKPRKVKKAIESKYRDRAAERRDGGGNDYAQVEAVLEEFEKRHVNNANKNEVEQQRKYLGGDSEHSILVKGLDIALLEANKAKAALSTEDDETLENAFLGNSPPTPQPITIPKKRTREELIRELKEKRGQVQNSGTGGPEGPVEEEAKLLEEAKKAGKFKPIGFKPISEEKPKKKKAKSEAKDGERKKKRKIDEAVWHGQSAVAEGASTSRESGDRSSVTVSTESSAERVVKPISSTSKLPELEPEPMPDDFNIFADVGEYEGLDLGDEEDGEVDANATPPSKRDKIPSAMTSQRWIPMDEDDTALEPSDHEPPASNLRSHSPARLPHPGRAVPVEEEETEDGPARLEPLASSALPSIKDFLAMDKAVEAAETRKKRKEKKKAKSGK
ncbi:hypothetical protein AX17_004182 [Amanita inopinata Kibby_2008]|nr:hypothetical protein AX17_004182 [Amanita inopinata Kibby_2008]